MVPMEFHLQTIFILLSALVIGSHAALPAVTYWHSKWPNTPIPQQLQNLLQPDTRENHKFYEKRAVEAIKEGPFKAWWYHYAAVEAAKLPNTTLFFVFDDLHKGKKMTLDVSKSVDKARILPHKVSKSIPFSTDKVPEIFKSFSLEATSPQGKLVEQTIKECEASRTKGEEGICARSLESIVDFSSKYVGNNPQVLMNEVDKSKTQEYTITNVKYAGENHVVCHKQVYPYAVYFCHTFVSTKIYKAELLGADGTKVTAAAICHSDTSNWNPKFLALLILDMKPGEGTICHFIRSDTFVIVSEAEEKKISDVTKSFQNNPVS